MEQNESNTEVTVTPENAELTTINDLYDLKVAGVDFCITLQDFAENSTGATKQILDAIINSDKFKLVLQLSQAKK
jgi:hypothetical protein